ncbi:hypothetical protein E4417_02045 [Stenotrophomonas maltophilia]|uniref:hypothetical protein n=1 Tax=Stenotrophomonas maltophilia TaxID=40324 RepID=UPI0010949245|nr:hypothetical protein [Stenotrophomonas maltophilia]TGW22645.1 hypothetical protein E4417_02045 [Stenotrophomonas maltophilia]
MQGTHHSIRRPRHAALLIAALLLAACQRTADLPAEAPSGDTPVVAPTAATDLSPLLDALPTCALDGWYIDQQTDRPAHSWLAANAPKPCKEDEENEIATFCVQGQWKGLPVEEVILPTMTFVSFRGARIGLPLGKARSIARQHLGQDFPGGAAYEAGREPKLLADPEDAQRSWLLCSTPELGHDVDSEGSISYSGMNLPYDHDGCSYRYSPVDFCDAQHRAAIEDALQHQKPNFNQHYLLVQVDDRPEYFQRTLVLVDTRTGRATPLPFDAFTGPAGKGGDATGYGALETSVDQPQFCLDGALLVYRVFEEGRFCFGFDGERFTGHETQYMQAAESP